jgi:pilus assembly protein Flp/PilA
MNASISKFLREEDGITALEYGILAALVATALTTIFLPGITSVFNNVFTALASAVTKATS